ncbi:uncharacterized protein LOC111519747 isoform X1 [Drosophila willistoni]|uniref:uncharacterized protein LOC111519747 isoform X1 n=1 Tax=Drosophila willistoni TaxID=7260 RepID=UPI001F078DD3|nr:uncharacterized protein LOC111519747 isoform X1 [Drosophila willistoni]XP_046868115.1 uncharacterized protein LOC111519747 isoform X1 [Drosophila willistoni]
MNNNEILQENLRRITCFAELDDDFWYLVLQVSPLDDQLNLVKSFPRLKSLCKLANKKQIQVLSTKELSYPNIDRALRWFGEDMKVLYVNDSFSPTERCECLRAVQEFCDNIESISFKTPVTKCLSNYYERMKSLHSIHMDYHVDSDDCLLEMFGQIPLLRSIHLTNFDTSKLRKMKGVENVEVLKVDGKVTIYDMYHVLLSFLNLRILRLNCPGNLDLDYLDFLPLEEIDISQQTTKCSIPYYPNLKRLRINSSSIKLKVILENRVEYYANRLEKLHYVTETDFETAEIISQFVMLKDLACRPSDPESFQCLLQFNRLERLNVSGNWENFGDYVLLMVHNNLQTLEYLDISFCGTITTQFVYELLNLLEKKSNLPLNRFKLIAKFTYIDSRIMSMLGDRVNLIDITVTYY